MTDQQIFEEQRIAQGETEARMSVIGSTRKAGSGMNPDRLSDAPEVDVSLVTFHRARSGSRESQKARGIVVQNVALLFGRQKGRRLDRLDGDAQSLWPDHLIGPEHHTSPEPRLDEAS
jgi:hypothetical protein